MSKTVLTFSVPTINERHTVESLVFHVEQSDLAFPNIYLLRHKYGTRIAIHHHCLYRHFSGTGRLQGYAFPVGCDIDINEALFHVEQHAEEHGNPLLFCLLTEENAYILQQRYGDKISFSSDPGDADYLYKRDDLAYLPGTAFHKKRNHIARFEREHADWEYRELTADRCDDALLIARSWASAQEAAPTHEHELQAIEKALLHRDQLGIFGGLLYVKNRPVALSLASQINARVADIHYEKCVPEYREAYPIINREMALRLDCELINREEDLNIPGLRQAKLSYKPAQILRKLKAIVHPC